MRGAILRSMSRKVEWSEGKPVEAVKPSVFLRRDVYERAKKRAKKSGLSFSAWVEEMILEHLKAA